MRLKPGVSLRGVRAETAVAMMITDATLGAITVTSVTEGTHKRASAHYTGRAFDLRTPVTTNATGFVNLHEKLLAELGAEFDVVIEADHWHVEYDPKEPL